MQASALLPGPSSAVTLFHEQGYQIRYTRHLIDNVSLAAFPKREKITQTTPDGHGDTSDGKWRHIQMPGSFMFLRRPVSAQTQEKPAVAGAKRAMRRRLDAPCESCASA